MRPIQTYLPTPSPHNSVSQQLRGLSFGPQEQKSGLRAMPEGTERYAKKRQGQNWPGKNVLPNFSMKIKAAPLVFPNHCLSKTINLFIKWDPCIVLMTTIKECKMCNCFNLSREVLLATTTKFLGSSYPTSRPAVLFW